MPSSSPSRRGFLAACSAVPFAGCSALARSEPADVVAGVEWKSIRGVRDDRSTPVLDNQPTDTVEHDAPVDLDLHTHVLDDGVETDGVTVPDTGSLVVDGALADRLDARYDELTHVLVFTLYERERVVGVPLGNSYGYRVSREGFNRVDPGDRVVVNVVERDDVAWIDEVVDVTSA